MQRETEDRRENGAVDHRHGGGGRYRERRHRQQQAGDRGDDRDGGELYQRYQVDVVILQYLGNGDDVAGDHEGAEGRDQVATVEALAAAGSQQPDSGHSQRDAGHVDPADSVAPDDPGDQRDEEHEQVVEYAGPRDAGALYAEDEAQVGQPQRRADDQAPFQRAPVEPFQTGGEADQHDQRRQAEPGQHEKLRRDAGDPDFSEQETAPPEEGGQHQEKIDPPHGRGCRRVH